MATEFILFLKTIAMIFGRGLYLAVVVFLESLLFVSFMCLLKRL